MIRQQLKVKVYSQFTKRFIKNRNFLFYEKVKIIHIIALIFRL